jgi:AcrR family transcriptional regulator
MPVVRDYQLKRRAERQEETRRRIVEAAVALHEEVGPDATTVSAIAERAGVGRVTVYRHFPDEAALFAACSSQYYARHPFPDPEKWRGIEDVRKRLPTALRETYAYHRATEQMSAHVLADVRDAPVMAPYHEHWDRMVDVLATGWGLRGRRARMVRAAIALALSFETWRLLVRDRGLDEEDALDLARLLVLCCGSHERPNT